MIMTAQDAALTAGPDPGTAGTAGDSRPWLILAVISVAQLMTTLDLTVMNLALPSAQHALGFTTADRQWIVTAYALSFGSLLLFCGRLADLVGRKVTFLTGLAGFAAASALGGASTSFAMLVTARACQGVFAAMLAPSALSLLTTTFTDPRERGQAFGVWSAVAASGAGLGLLLGGAMTTYLSWRWCLYVNLVFAGVAIAGVALLVGKQHRVPGARLDIPGVAAVSGGMFCLVYGFANAATHSWRLPSTWAFLVAAAALLIVFVLWQHRTSDPLLPPRVILDRNRSGAYLAYLVIGAGLFGILLFLIYYMQGILGYSAITSGVAILPMIGVIAVVAGMVSTKLMPRLGPKPLVFVGLLLNGGAMAWLTRIGVHSGYATALLGPIMVVGIGMGTIFALVPNTGTFGVAPRDAGVASATIQVGQQLGGSIGTALLNTIAASATTSYLASHLHGRPAPQLAQLAAVHSYITVFWWCVGIFAAGAVICGALARPGPLTLPAGKDVFSSCLTDLVL
jgi:EmrB/QacA subfamily drug resistance transporter